MLLQFAWNAGSLLYCMANISPSAHKKLCFTQMAYGWVGACLCVLRVQVNTPNEQGVVIVARRTRPVTV
jgi:hypothetical protein